MLDKDKKSPKQTGFAAQRSEDRPESSQNTSLDSLYQKLHPEMRRPKPSPDAMAAALEVVQRLAADAEAENGAEDCAEDLAGDFRLCAVCGYRNREGNRFCGMCGLPVEAHDEAGSPQHHLSPEITLPGPQAERMPMAKPGMRSASAAETHHFHHHYHHHYFPAGQEGIAARRSTAEVARESEKLRSSAALRGESMSRAEAAVRRLTQEWVLACNTKHLDDVLDLYIADALVLRSNYPPVRGAAAIREFFFGTLDAGLGDVEVDPILVEVAGDMAYEAGRWKALVPGAAGKRREERGKYLWIFARQSNGEWKLAADCWSSDLTLGAAELDVTPGTAPKPNPPRKGA
jgi:uncharacterized protein (TIGR02246 family)